MIHRTKTNHNYTVVHNEFLRNDKLSWKAKGLLTYLISLPPDWKIHLQDLRTRSRDSIDATRTAMRELIIHGYAYFTKEKDDRGQFISGDYYISDEPIFKGIAFDYPGLENPMQENQGLENQTLLNTILTKYFDLQNTQEEEPTPPSPRINGVKKTTFKNSEIAEKDDFVKLIRMDELDQLGTNYVYYYEYISRWAANKGAKTDWIAFVQKWILGDYKNGKLKKVSELNMKYLQGYE